MTHKEMIRINSKIRIREIKLKKTEDVFYYLDNIAGRIAEKMLRFTGDYKCTKAGKKLHFILDKS